MYFILSYMHDIIFKLINSLIYLLLNRKYLYNLIFDIIKKICGSIFNNNTCIIYIQILNNDNVGI
jgi:hypothetical protein